jgi:uncharacterized membrane protein
MFELLFRHPAADFRAGELIWLAAAPPWVLALALGAAVAGGAWLYLRAARRFSRGAAAAIAALDLAAAVLALALLWRPALAVDRLESTRRVVAVLIDASRSMGFAEGDRTRLDVALEALERAVQGPLEQRFDVRYYAFAEGVEPIPALRELPPLGERTRLAAALREVLASSHSLPLSAVLLVSDGAGRQADELDALWGEIERAGVPIHTVGVGREALPEDLELADVRLPSVGLPGARLDARVLIRHAAPGSTRLRVREGDAILAARAIELDPKQREQLVSISIPAGSAGVRDLRFSLEPLPGERITGNNAQSRIVEVSGRRRRILYLEGEPRWEYAFVRRALAADPAVELVAVLRTTDRKHYRQGVRGPEELADGFPAQREELFAYDALILGSVTAAELEPAQHELIRAFVGERGGGLLMLGGRNGLADGGWGVTAVHELLPVRLPARSDQDPPTFARRPVRAVLTVHGQTSAIVQLDADPERNRALWSELPPLADHQLAGELRPGAVALLDAALGSRSTPLLAVQRYGRGRSAVLASGGTWRWKMGLPHDDVRFATFWSQLLRFLAGSSPEPVSLSLRAASAAGAASRGAEGARVRVDVQDAARRPVDSARVRLSVVPESGAAQELELGRAGERGAYEADLALEPGRSYRLQATARLGANELGSQELHFRSADDLGEDFCPELNRALLERIATRSGGAFWTPDALAGLPDALRDSGLGVRRREISELWSIPAFFLLLLALKSAAWVVRRRAGAP